MTTDFLARFREADRQIAYSVALYDEANAARERGHHEDNPTKVEAWKKSRPSYDDPQDYVWYKPTPDRNREPMRAFQSGER